MVRVASNRFEREVLAGRRAAAHARSFSRALEEAMAQQRYACAPAAATNPDEENYSPSMNWVETRTRFRPEPTREQNAPAPIDAPSDQDRGVWIEGGGPPKFPKSKPRKPRIIDNRP